ncbi:GNAT family N-acetyltransferase [Spirosoma luteolum]
MPRLLETTPAQHPVIQQIAHQTWPSTFGAILSPAQIDYMLSWMYSIDALHEQVEQKGHVFLLAESDTGEPLGFCSYELHAGGQPVTKVHKIYLLPAAQGQGVGRLLLDAVAARATEAGDRALRLNVNRFNKAVSFYEKVGFSVVGQEDIDIGNGFLMEDYIMAKPL